MVAEAPKDDKSSPAPPEKPKQNDVEKVTADTTAPKEETRSSQKVATDEIKAAETGPQRIDAASSEQLAQEKTFTAARHTYDVGYNKWESFDVDAEMRKVDKPAPSKPKQQLVDVESYEKKSAVADLDFDDPVKALDQAIQRARDKEGTLAKSDAEEVAIAASQTLPDQKPETTTKMEISPDPNAVQTARPKTLSDQYKRWDKFDADEASDGEGCEEEIAALARGLTDQALQSNTHVPNVGASSESTSKSQTPPTSSGPGRPEVVLNTQVTQDSVIIEELQEPIAVAESGGGADNTTALSLNNEYKKWDNFDPDDEMDDISDDDTFGGDMDLDALTGPKEEVAQIQRHWKREAAACRRKIRKENEETKAAERKAQLEARTSLSEGAQIQRPCVYRPEHDPESTAAKAIRRDYNKWKDFDVDAAVLELDNEGKTAEGDAMRCEARKGSAMVQAEGYTKDREEFDLDQDIEKQVGSLKKVIAQRLKDATALKTEGNSFLRNGRAQDACRMYREGLSTMELCEQASVIMADTMADKNLRLIADLHRNMAAAQLEVGDYEGAKESCDSALKLSSQRKDDCGNRDAGGDDDKAHYRRALALLRLGRNQDARKDIEALVAVRGENDSAVKKLRAEDRAD